MLCSFFLSKPISICALYFNIYIDSTLPSIEALHTLIGVKKCSLELCQHLQVPYCVVQEIHQQTSDATEQKEIFLKRWLSEHPAPSIAVVTEALYQMEEHEILKKLIHSMLLRGWDVH